MVILDRKDLLYTRLLFTLVGLLLVGVLTSGALTTTILYALLGIVMVIAVWQKSHRRLPTLVTFVIGLANVGATFWTGIETEPTTLSIAASRLTGVLFVGTVGSFLLREVWQENHVTLDTIAGAITVYVLIGIGWTHIYSLIETLEPGSFFMPLIDSAESLETRKHVGAYPNLLFFSFVTLTTLGYGDTLPTTASAKGFAIAEAIAGPLFLATLMARLVGLYIANESKRHSPPEREPRGD